MWYLLYTPWCGTLCIHPGVVLSVYTLVWYTVYTLVWYSLYTLVWYSLYNPSMVLPVYILRCSWKGWHFRQIGSKWHFFFCQMRCLLFVFFCQMFKFKDVLQQIEWSQIIFLLNSKTGCHFVQLLMTPKLVAWCFFGVTFLPSNLLFYALQVKYFVTWFSSSLKERVLLFGSLALVGYLLYSPWCSLPVYLYRKQWVHVNIIMLSRSDEVFVSYLSMATS